MLAEEDRSRLNAILEATTDIVAVADASGEVLYLNKAGHALLARSLSLPDVATGEAKTHNALNAAKVLIRGALAQAEKHGVWER